MNLSLKEKIQSWYALVLGGLLFVLGVGFYYYEKAHQLAALDQQLDQLIPMLLRSQLPPDDRGPPPIDRRQRPGDATQVAVVSLGLHGWERRDSMESFQGTAPGKAQGIELGLRSFEENFVPLGYYFRIESKKERRAEASSNYPAIAFPEGLGIGYFKRFRDDAFRELYHETSRFRMLVGTSIQEFNARLFKLRIYIGAGALVFFLVSFGLGWVLVSRSIQPLKDIERTASRIADGSLSERIQNVNPADAAELKSLSNHLNLTFERLEQSFDRQLRFTADASHELRTPLTALIAQIEFGLEKVRSTEEYIRVLEACGRSSQRIQRITEQLIELSRYDSGRISMDFEVVNLDCILLSLAGELRPYVEKHGCALETDFAPGEVRCDPFRLEQVITNLVNNAIQHNDPGITITLSSKIEEESFSIEVCDNGKGIRAESIEHLFDRFFQESRSRTKKTETGNVGLGLAISKAIAKAHGGTIEISSKAFVETCFKVCIPSN